MNSTIGERIKVTLFGEAHGPALGLVMEGLPAGEAVDMEQLQRFLLRRAPGRAAYASPRRETDQPIFLSGLAGGATTGAPLSAIIRNEDVRAADYQDLAALPRPGHADYAAYLKWGAAAELSGGGHFSGRLTAPLCVAGGVARQFLARRGVTVGAHVAAVGAIVDRPFPLHPQPALLETIAEQDFPTIDQEAGQRMLAAISAAQAEGDSLGGVIEGVAVNVPPGLGGPLFGGLESRLAAALFGIPAVKGVEFGSGFGGAALRGSENNDAIIITEQGFSLESNNCGGILGGISCAMPLLFRVAIKPTPSIAKPQRTVNLRTHEAATVSVSGRHDACIAPRAVPVVEAITALVLLDMIMEEGC